MQKKINRQLEIYNNGIFYQEHEPTFIEDIKITFPQSFFNYLTFKIDNTERDTESCYDSYENRLAALFIFAYLAIGGISTYCTQTTLSDIITSTGHTTNTSANKIINQYKEALVLLQELKYIIVDDSNYEMMSTEQLLGLKPKTPITIWTNKDALFDNGYFLTCSLKDILPIFNYQGKKTSKFHLLATYLVIKEQIIWGTKWLKEHKLLPDSDKENKEYLGYATYKSITKKNNIANMTAQRYVEILQSLGMIYKYNLSKQYNNKWTASVYSLDEKTIKQKALIKKYIETYYGE